jgi:hypothetical protein
MNCINCDHNLDKTDNFCSVCGGKVITQRLTFRLVIKEMVEKFFSWDNKFFLTYISLFTRPEDVINGFIKGMRAKYLNAFTYFFIALTISGIQILLLQKGYLGEIDYGFEDIPQEGIPFSLDSWMSIIYDYYSFIAFLLIPLMALMSKIVFWKVKNFNYIEHLVIYFYTNSQTSILGAVFGIFILSFTNDFIMVSYFLYPMMIGYHIYALRRVFNLTSKQIFIKTLVFLGVAILFYILLVIFFVIVYFIIMSQNGELQQLQEMNSE